MLVSLMIAILGHFVILLFRGCFLLLERLLRKYELMWPDCRPVESTAASFMVLRLPITSLAVFSMSFRAQDDVSSRLDAF